MQSVCQLHSQSSVGRGREWHCSVCQSGPALTRRVVHCYHQKRLTMPMKTMFLSGARPFSRVIRIARCTW